VTPEDEAAACAEQAANYREVPLDLYVCRCRHEHAPGQAWCFICEYPVRNPVTQDSIDAEIAWLKTELRE